MTDIFDTIAPDDIFDRAAKLAPKRPVFSQADYERALKEGQVAFPQATEEELAKARMVLSPDYVGPPERTQPPIKLGTYPSREQIYKAYYRQMASPDIRAKIERISKEGRGFWSELANSLVRGSMNVAAGLAGTTEKAAELIDKPGISWLGRQAGKVKQTYQAGQMIPELTPGRKGGAGEFVAQAVGETFPFMAVSTLATLGTGSLWGAFSVAFAVEGENAYQSAIEQGASEHEANMERLVVGTINGAIEQLQIWGILKGGKKAAQPLIKAAKNKALNKIFRGGIVAGTELVKTAINEGIEESLQESVGMLAPAMHGRAVPEAGEFLKRAGRAGLGGAVGGGILGGGAAVGTALTQQEPSITTRQLAEEFLKPAEKPSRAAMIRAADKAVGKQRISPKRTSAVEKLTNLIKSAIPARQETEKLKHEEVKRRVAIASRILEEGKGREAFLESKKPLKGRLPQAEFEPPQNVMTESDVMELFDQIRTSNKRYFDRLNASEALTKVLMGQIPQEKELLLLEEQFGKELVRAILDKRSLGQKSWESFLNIANIPRAVLASFDISASLRQGIILGIDQPKAWLSAFKGQIKAIFNEKYAAQSQERIKNSANYDLYKESGLYIAPWKSEAALTAREEKFQTRFAEKIPGVRLSERAYITFLNELRTRAFDNIVEQAQSQGADLTMSDYKQLAAFINYATGRGHIGFKQRSSDLAMMLNAFFFSPRYQVSRFQLPYKLFSKSKAARMKTAAALTKFVSTGLMMLALIELSGLGDVEDDPRSSDFGKVKVGNTRFDIWAGYSQIARLITHLITGQRKTTTTGKIIKQNRLEALNRFLRYKLSPPAALVMDILEGRTPVGEEMEFSVTGMERILYRRMTPITVQDIIDAIQYQGLDGSTLAAIPASALGIGVQTWPEKSKKQLFKKGKKKKLFK